MDVTREDPPVQRTRGRARRGSLTTERIVAAAIHVLDKDGLDALTIGRLAADLKVGPMSLYTHFRDKSSILSAVVAELFGRLRLPERTIPDIAYLRKVVLAYFTFLTENPVLLVLDATWEVVDLEARVSEQMYSCMIHLDIENRAAVGYVAMLMRFTVGSAFIYPRRHRWDEESDYWERYRSQLFAALAPSEFPSMHSILREFEPVSQEQTFEYGLDTMLAAIERHHRA